MRRVAVSVRSWGMSLFRKAQTEAPPASVNAVRGSQPRLTEGTPMFNGPNVDIAAIYRTAKLVAEELDRVNRAEALLHHLPKKAPDTREVVEATLRAFGVDRSKIIEAARKQLDALEAFIRYSHEQMQQILDANARRIAELEGEIERCRQASDEATREGEERARTVNNELVKVEGVLGFFGDEDSHAMDVPTVVVKPNAEDKPAQRPAG
jgi:hypothetical protein